MGFNWDAFYEWIIYGVLGQIKMKGDALQEVQGIFFLQNGV